MVPWMQGTVVLTRLKVFSPFVVIVCCEWKCYQNALSLVLIISSFLSGALCVSSAFCEIYPAGTTIVCVPVQYHIERLYWYWPEGG